MSLQTSQGIGAPIHEPPPDSRFPLVLRGQPDARLRAGIGVMMALAGYVVITQLVVTLVLGIGYAVRRPEGGFSAYRVRALAYELPEGVVAGHLGLAMMIVLVLALVRYWHGLDPRWAVSVQPGMRWRYLLVCVLVAVVVLNVAAWWQAGWQLVWQPQPHVWGWIALVVLTSPFQAAGEEFLFRGYLTQAGGTLSGSSMAAVVASAAVFALFHGTQNGWLFLDRFAFGIVAGVLVVLTGGLEAAIGAHAINNVFAFAYAAVSGGVAVARATQEIGPRQALFDVGAFALYGVIAVLIARRMNLATRS